MGNQVKILVVEDEIIIADDICDTLRNFDYAVLEPAISYSEAIQLLEDESPDIAILDIQLAGKKSGLDLAETIKAKFHIPFIFLTSNSDRETLESAKRCQPATFLVKPYGKEELFAAIEIALYNFSQQKEQALDRENLIIKDSLFIKQKKAFVRIQFDDILYLESDHVYIDIHLKNEKKYTVRGALNEFIEKLGPTFFRSHRSFIINLTYLEGINTNHTTLQGKEIPLGKNYREEILAKLTTG